MGIGSTAAGAVGTGGALAPTVLLATDLCIAAIAFNEASNRSKGETTGRLGVGALCVAGVGAALAGAAGTGGAATPAVLLATDLCINAAAANEVVNRT